MKRNLAKEIMVYILSPLLMIFALMIITIGLKLLAL